jgi:sugar/nucleoside kinase (ribokinase family)
MPRFDVTVVGELNLDLIFYGLPQQLVPERELIARSMTLTLGSSSAIFAHNLSVIGSKVGFISRIGDDPLGQVALDRLTAGGVDVSKVRKGSGPTTTGLTVILPRTCGRNILTYPGTMNDMCWDDLDLEYLADSKHFHLSSFFLHQALRAHIPKLFRTMKERGLTTSLDTNDDPDDRWDSDLSETLNYVDVFLLNAREVRKIAPAQDLETAISALSKRVPILAVKLGAEGAIGASSPGQVRCPALQVEVVDPVGAGDSFDAGFIHRYVRGGDLVDCLAHGNLTGAFSTTRPGGTEAFLDRTHLERFFSQHVREGKRP